MKCRYCVEVQILTFAASYYIRAIFMHVILFHTPSSKEWNALLKVVRENTVHSIKHLYSLFLRIKTMYLHFTAWKYIQYEGNIEQFSDPFCPNTTIHMQGAKTTISWCKRLLIREVFDKYLGNCSHFSIKSMLWPSFAFLDEAVLLSILTYERMEKWENFTKYFTENVGLVLRYDSITSCVLI